MNKCNIILRNDFGAKVHYWNYTQYVCVAAFCGFVVSDDFITSVRIFHFQLSNRCHCSIEKYTLIYYTEPSRIWYTHLKKAILYKATVGIADYVPTFLYIYIYIYILSNTQTKVLSRPFPIRSPVVTINWGFPRKQLSLSARNIRPPVHYVSFRGMRVWFLFKIIDVKMYQ